MAGGPADAGHRHRSGGPDRSGKPGQRRETVPSVAGSPETLTGPCALRTLIAVTVCIEEAGWPALPPEPQPATAIRVATAARTAAILTTRQISANRRMKLSSIYASSPSSCKSLTAIADQAPAPYATDAPIGSPRWSRYLIAPWRRQLAIASAP